MEEPTEASTSPLETGAWPAVGIPDQPAVQTNKHDVRECRLAGLPKPPGPEFIAQRAVRLGFAAVNEQVISVGGAQPAHRVLV